MALREQLWAVRVNEEPDEHIGSHPHEEMKQLDDCEEGDDIDAFCSEVATYSKGDLLKKLSSSKLFLPLARLPHHI